MEQALPLGARPRRLLTVLAAFGLSGLLAHALLGTGSAWRAIVLPAVGGIVLLGALAACGARALRVERDRAAWACLTAGVAAWTAGWVVGSVEFALAGASGGPTVADALYLSFYPCAYVGLGLLVRGRSLAFPPSVWLDGLIGGLAVAAVGACLIVGPLVELLGGEVTTVVVGLAYPLCDLVLLALVVGVLALTRWRADREWALLGAGLAFFALADTAYVVLTAQGEAATIALGALWVSSIVFLATAAWSERRPVPAAVALEGWRVLVVPLVLAAVAVGLLVYGQGADLPTVGVVLATATLVAVMVRMALTFQENLRLLQARRQAMTDDLTGLANRRRLLARLDRLLSGAPEPVGLLLIDLDRFKELNDALGHHVGDLLLEQLSARLLAALPGSDLVARLGGDEFAVLVRGADADELARAAYALQAALEAPFALDGLALAVQASAGGALHPEHAQDAGELLQRADVAMYAAKRARSGYALYDPHRDLHSRGRLALTQDLRAAIGAGELVLHYQPKGELPGGRVTGVEALVRWEHPEHGLLAPAAFVGLAEEAGLARPLTLWVLDAALDQLVAWDAAGLRLDVAVNLAMANLLDPSLPAEVGRALGKRGIAPSRLVLEVTEDLVMADPGLPLGVLDGLDALGVALSLDDFGAGRSSLAYLRRLPVGEVKIDRSFVRRMGEDPDEALVVRAVVRLARDLGLRVVAEGVEDAASWEQLERLGCHAAQGYHLARPLEVAALEVWLAARADALPLLALSPGALEE